MIVTDSSVIQSNPNYSSLLTINNVEVKLPIKLKLAIRKDKICSTNVYVGVGGGMN